VRHLISISLLSISLGTSLAAQQGQQPAAPAAPVQAPQNQSAQPQGTGTTPAQGIAASQGLFVYPKNQQTPEVQHQDEAACYEWAKQQTGIDPVSGAAPGQQQQAEADSPKGGGAKGAAKGAAAGAAIGAITGDAGTGAGVGAVAGGIGGRRQQKKAKKQAEQQAQQQQQAASAQVQDTFKKAMSTCLDGRGYSVK